MYSICDENVVSYMADMTKKRTAARKLIERYYYQLTDGCGKPECSNIHCASSGKIQKLSPDQAAAMALQLFVSHPRAKLCESNSPKMAKLPEVFNNSPNKAGSSQVDNTQETMQGCVSSTTNKAGYMDISNDPKGDWINSNRNKSNQCHQVRNMINSDEDDDDDDCEFSQIVDVISPFQPSTSNSKRLPCYGLLEDNIIPNSGGQIPYLNEKILTDIIEKCIQQGSYSLLIRTLGQVFSSEESLKISFLKERNDFTYKEYLTKEDMRAMEIDEDKDQDSKENFNNPDVKCAHYLKSNEVTVDIYSVRRAFSALFAIPNHPFQHALINALLILCENLEIDFKYKKSHQIDPNLLNTFIIIMEIPMLECPEYLEAALPAICKAAAQLNLQAQANLAKVWSQVGATRLKEMLDTLHQLITLRVISGHFTRDYCVNEEEIIVAATKLMKILFYANIYGGEMDKEDFITEENEQNEEEERFQDFLPGSIGRESKESKLTKEDPLGKELGVKVLNCRKPVIPFEEFCNDPLSDQIEMDRDFANYKTEAGRFSFMNYAFILTPAVKTLGLYYDNRIRMYSERRQSIIHSLVHGAPPNPYLRLRIRRDHIIDDALVGLEMVAMENPNNLKKQLVVEFEGEQGIDEGGVSKEFFQLVVEEIFNPDFAMFTLNSETQTYWFNPTSFESDAQFTLIGIILGLAIYNNIILDVHFPMVVYRKLMGRKGTFHDLHDWNPILANGLEELLAYEDDDMEEVFLQTFRIMYQDVFDTVLSHDLKEGGNQILVNQDNKQNFDFNALEETTEYDGGYTSDTTIIRSFWGIVHDFSLEQKRKLLQFTTGSDRVPVGGLSKLKLVIARHGPDSDRLPTAHTCFNVLLLPEYSSKEKLQERLLKAINYSKGFGML
ncbi:ubiquitin-protein ligase E3A-like [Centruroides sculpturatus]|uniref:ubiquitin-protein ligase E3A-like n=1 Tax=Centruroides sculpturatus TaxID=218467 RepID=UPI000C6CF002|nr:ubiquitin-protein ligase E3A-like [Centruroides sculpturatus]